MATVCMDEMLYNVIIWIYLAAFLTRCTADFCNWSGSSFTDEKGPGLVLQVRLRCATGWIRWFSPGQALRVVLEPTLSSTLRPTVCIKPSPSLRGVNVFIERSGRLKLLAMEKMACFRADGDHGPMPIIYLEASVRSAVPWRRRTVGLKYELTYPRTGASPDQTGLEEDSCRPCNNTELLMAVCVSDFVVRGSIQKVSHNSNRQTSLIHVSATRVYRQHGSLFEQRMSHLPPVSSPSWSGHISTLLQCHIKPGDGEFLFTGSEHFGDAWLGCAPDSKTSCQCTTAPGQHGATPVISLWTEDQLSLSGTCPIHRPPHLCTALRGQSSVVIASSCALGVARSITNQDGVFHSLLEHSLGKAHRWGIPQLQESLMSLFHCFYGTLGGGGVCSLDAPPPHLLSKLPYLFISSFM